MLPDNPDQEWLREEATSALEQAERSSPDVKAAALLRVSRIIGVSNHPEGVRVLERGIAAAQALREPMRIVLLAEAFTAAAIVSPDHAFRLLPELEGVPFHHIPAALYRMTEHGHHDAALRYLLSAPEEADFPFDSVEQALYGADDDARLALLRKAAHTFRRVFVREPSALPPQSFECLTLFGKYWRLLPRDEAGSLIRELVESIAAARHDPRGDLRMQGMRFSSTRQYSLFLLFGPCSHLEPQLAERLVADYPQLARAVAQFPNGLESIYGRIERLGSLNALQATQTEPDLAEQAQMDYVSLDGGDVPVADELRTGFKRSFEIALNSYAIDTDHRHPNTAPRCCWPSAHNFRSILYKAGHYEGRAAVRHLERVPDPSLQLFARIELAAALAGLSQVGGMTMTQGPEYRPPRTRPAHAAESDFEPAMPPPFPGKPDVAPSYDPRIALTRLDRSSPPTGGCDADYWVIEGAPLRPVLAELFEISPLRIILPPRLEETRYDFALILPRGESREVLLSTMRGGVERHFKVRRHRRAVDVQVITAPGGVRAYESLAQGAGWSSDGSFEFTYESSSPPPGFEDMSVAALMDLSIVAPAVQNVGDELRRAHGRFLRTFGGGTLRGVHDSLTMADLCLMLETSLKRIFVDETGTSATYRIDIQADVRDSDAFLAVLCEELGLTILSGRREVEMLVVEA